MQDYKQLRTIKGVASLAKQGIDVEKKRVCQIKSREAFSQEQKRGTHEHQVHL
jgi:hypothetical protein